MAQFEDNQFYQYPPFNPIIPAPVWGKDAEYAVPVVSSVGSGPKGEKGDVMQFDDLTKAQKNALFNEMAKNVVNYGYTLEQDSYVTEDESTSIIEIPISDWSAYDILLVDIEGLTILSGSDYNIVGDTIHLTTPIVHTGTKIGFSAIKVSIPEGEKAVVNTVHVVPEITATVDNTHLDTPSVEAVLTEEGGFQLNFSGLMGEKGDKGDDGETGSDGFNTVKLYTQQNTGSVTVQQNSMAYFDLMVTDDPVNSSITDWLEANGYLSDGVFVAPDWTDIACPNPMGPGLIYARWAWFTNSSTGDRCPRVYMYNPTNVGVVLQYPINARMITYKKPE